jgi:hypothetical protein
LTLTFLCYARHYRFRGGTASMWKQNFMFRAQGDVPLKESEQELFHEADLAMDSAGLNLERFLSVWVQGEGQDDEPSMYTSLYVRTAMLDVGKRVGFLQPLQGRTHQIKQMLTAGQKQFLHQWLSQHSPTAWAASDEQFHELFTIE